MAALMQQAVILLTGWASGLSIYLTVALLGISGRFGWLDLPGNMKTLENPLIIIAAIAIYAIEFVADKIPFVDSAWDSVHTFIRPLGAAGVGYMAGSDSGPVIQTFYGLVTGTLALDTHAVKATGRLAINTSPEPFSNIAASVSEDAAVIFLFWLFIKHPIIALALILLFLIASFFFLRMMWRFVVKIFRWFKKDKTPAVSQ